MTHRDDVHICFFRHGETDWNAEGRLQGSTDIPLNSKGREQALSLASRLSAFGIEHVLSSPLLRAAVTAEIVASEVGVDVSHHPDLRELSLGEAEGRLRAELGEGERARHWERWCEMREDAVDINFMGSETKRSGRERLRAAVEDFVTEKRVSRLGVATHGMVLRTFIHGVCGDSTQRIPMTNCAAYALTFNRGTRLWRFVGPV